MAPAGTSRHSPFFFAPLPADGGEPLVLEGTNARHLAVVRRAVAGDLISVCDGQGALAEARLASVTATRVVGEILSLSVSPARAPSVHLLQGLAKGDKVDGVIRHLVELGVDAISVFGSDRSVARWDGPREAAAATRWAAVAHEAAKQSRQRWLPTLRGPCSLKQAVAALSGHASASGRNLGLVAHPAAGRRLNEVLGSLPAAGPGISQRWSEHDRVWLVVGPEGGLAPDEVAAFEAAGATAVSLGEQILRTETAGVVLASLLLHHTGRLG